jgi:hypothetical protein
LVTRTGRREAMRAIEEERSMFVDLLKAEHY